MIGKKPPKDGQTGSVSANGVGAENRSFRKNARLADVIDRDGAVVDRLAALHPAFARLRDPEALRSLSRRVTLREAAGIAGVPVAAVIAAANGTACVAASAPDPREEEPLPAWMDGFDESKAAQLDVRPALAENREPFAEIMAVVRTVEAGGGLILDAPFNPVPLRRVLDKQGFVSFARRLNEGHWRVWCRRERTLSPAAEGRAHGKARVWRAQDGVHIDVRGLAAPRPLVAILALIDGGNHDGVVVVHHEREPMHLFPELAERHWTYDIVPGEAGEVRLILRSALG